MSQIVIVSGPPGAGKSTVCESLCERYDRTVHLQTDDVYAWIRMGFVPPWKEGSRRQNETVSRACAAAAAAFARDRYGVFIDGVILPWALAAHLDQLREAGVAVHYAALLPTVDVILGRARQREKVIAGAGDEMLRQLHRAYVDASPLPGFTLDTSNLTADAAADRVMDACGSGEALVWSPDA